MYGNTAHIEFIDRDRVAFSASTCSKTLSLNPNIVDYSSFVRGLRLLMSGTQFTMP